MLSTRAVFGSLLDLHKQVWPKKIVCRVNGCELVEGQPHFLNKRMRLHELSFLSKTAICPVIFEFVDFRVR